MSAESRRRRTAQRLTRGLAGIYHYPNGQRERFDPDAVRRQLAGCYLCGAPIVLVGMFCPTTASLQAAVLKLRQHPVLARSTPAMTYGLCKAHARDPEAVFDRVEAGILKAAERVVTQ